MHLIFEIEKTLQNLYPELLEFPWLKKTSLEPNPVQLPEIDKCSIQTCTRCDFHLGREKAVLPRGLRESPILFVGDLPSDDDDRTGIAFSGPSGELLNKMILAMNLQPTQVCLSNLAYCRPPSKIEIRETDFRVCSTLYIENELRTFPRKVIVSLGERTAQYFSQSMSHLIALRNQELHWNGIRVFATHHPRDLLASPEKKKEAWADLKRVLHYLLRRP